MKKINCVLAFIVIGAVGALWHFVYEWSGESPIIGAIAPVNESVWEHLKLLFFPTLFYFAVEFFLCKERYENFIPASVIGIFAGMLTITSFFYTYTGVLGFNSPILDVLSYYLGLSVTLIIKSRILKNKSFSSKTAKYISLIFAAATAVLFGVWSFYPPRLGIFIPPAAV